MEICMKPKSHSNRGTKGEIAKAAKASEEAAIAAVKCDHTLVV
jgi:hypothetical protein